MGVGTHVVGLGVMMDVASQGGILGVMVGVRVHSDSLGLMVARESW